MNNDDRRPAPTCAGVYCWAATDVGLVRTNNEDSYMVSGQADAEAGERWEGHLGPLAWALVADGMGGHAGGEVASALAVECLATVVPRLRTCQELSSAIEATNLALHDAMYLRPELEGMGTTVAGIAVRGSSAMIFNAGDSRIYGWSEGRLRRLSEDHVVSGYLLTKCLGGSSAAQAVEPFVAEVELTPGSRFLLCTDGLTDELDDETLADLLPMDRPAERLLDAALRNGGRDNVTVLVVEVA